MKFKFTYKSDNFGYYEIYETNEEDEIEYYLSYVGEYFMDKDDTCKYLVENLMQSDYCPLCFRDEKIKYVKVKKMEE